MNFPKEIWVYFEQADIVNKFEQIDDKHINTDYPAFGYGQYYASSVKSDLMRGHIMPNSVNIMCFKVVRKLVGNVYENLADKIGLFKFFTTFGDCMEYRQALLKDKIKQLTLQFDKSPHVIE